MNRRFRVGLAATSATLALILSACGSSDPSSDAGASSGPAKLRVTTLPLCEEIGLYTKDGGFFEKKGIQVELVKTTGGNAGVAALQSGSADVAFITATAAINAMKSGVDIQFISGAVRTSPGSNGVIVKADSPVKGPADLDGKTVGVLELAGSGATSIKNWVKNAIGKEPNIKFVQLPFPELVPAVLNGTVVGAQVTASEVYTLDKDGTGRSIGNPGYEVAGGSTPTGMYVMTTEFLKKHQKTAEDFVAAMDEAAKAANDPADTKHFDVLSSYCKKPAADLAKIPQESRATFEGYINRESFTRLTDVLHKGGAIPADFKPEDKVAPFAWAKN